MTSLKTCIFIYIFFGKKYLYIHNCKSEVSKAYSIVNASYIYIPEFYYFLYITLKLYMSRMTQNYIFE